MDEILDEPEHINKERKFSKLAFLVSLASLASFLYLLWSMPRTIKASDGLSEPPFALILFMLFSSLAGFTLTMVSMVVREPSSWIKWIGGVINILWFLMMGTIVIYALMKDTGE